MKQTLAMALAGFQGLGSDDFRERPIDRLGALGGIQNPAADGTRRAIDEQAKVTQQAMDTALLCSLGVDLIAFKFGNRAPSRADAEDKLSMVLGWPRLKLSLKPRQRDRIAHWTVTEWAIDMCPLCKGAKIIPDHGLNGHEGVQPMKPCPATEGCGGTGKRRYSDSERLQALGEKFEKAMSVAHGLIGEAEALAVRQAKAMLERWT